jgi:hypothetical protein
MHVTSGVEQKARFTDSQILLQFFHAHLFGRRGVATINFALKINGISDGAHVLELTAKDSDCRTAGTGVCGNYASKIAAFLGHFYISFMLHGCYYVVMWAGCACVKRG